MDSLGSKVLPTLALCALAIVVPIRARSCECDVAGLVEARELSDAAFSGQVTTLYLVESTPWGQPMNLAIVRVEDCWKGSLQRDQQIQVWTAACAGCCGENFTLGSRHMLFVRGAEPLFLTSWCFGNTQVGPEVAAALGPPACSLGVDAQLWSTIKRLYREP